MIKTLEENLNNLKENERRKNNTSLGTNKIPNDDNKFNNKLKILSINSSNIFKDIDLLESSQLILDERSQKKKNKLDFINNQTKKNTSKNKPYKDLNKNMNKDMEIVLKSEE